MVRVIRKPKNVAVGLPEYNARLFTWDGIAGCAELSDYAFQTAHRAHQAFARVWGDACDEGFWVKSPKTGQRILFLFGGQETDQEGEIIAWNFASYGTDRRVTIKLFND